MMMMVLVVMVGITVLLYLQVKKPVGGSARGMALYEDDVRPSQILDLTHLLKYFSPLEKNPN